MAISVLSLGACLLAAPIHELLTRDLIVDASAPQRGSMSDDYYTLEEAMQALRFYRGELEVPRALRPWCSLNPDWNGAGDAAGLFDRADVALLEINSPIAMMYRSFALCRSEVIERILTPLARRSEELHLIGNDWYYRGQLNGNAAMIADTAPPLIAAIGDDFPDAELARSIVRETRPEARDLAGLTEGVRAVEEMVRSPLGMVTYTHQYLPDGRPLPWPPDLVEQTHEVARRVGLPVFEPSAVVRRHGVAAAMEPDRTHYREEFKPILAEALFPFIAGIAARAGVPDGAETPRAAVVEPRRRRWSRILGR